MKKLFFSLVLILFPYLVQAQNAHDILAFIDANMSADSRIIEATTIIRGKRSDRTMTMLIYSEGITRSYTEYLSPPREAGTKMLKLENEMWVYSPSTDRTIMISGHMLRQSVMGSDMSYEDMMDDRKLLEVYNAEITGTEIINDRLCWVLSLTAFMDDAAYSSQKMWVDQEYLLPLRQELYAKSGQLLKLVELSNVLLVEGRWFPMWMRYQDMLGDGNGTEMLVTSITFNQPIPEHIFSKASLR